MIWPVIHQASGPASSATKSAMSAGSPTWPRRRCPGRRQLTDKTGLTAGEVTRQNSSGTCWPSTVTQYSMTRTVTVTPSPEISARYEPSARISEILFSGMSLFSRIRTCVQAMSWAIRAAPG
ncbi:MAG TPA: hypothetical protein VMV07_22245 [Streptosporangiaceae bacterium]|nr:hypothetical protein [Streptosporangiaceae bacterium]